MRAPSAPRNNAEMTRGKGFTFTQVSDLKARPPEYLVEGLLETNSLCLLFGDPGAAKSFVATDFAMSVATGTTFHGRKTKQGPVFVIAGEGHVGLPRRFHGWADDRACSLDGVPCFLSDRPAQLLDADSAGQVSEAIRALASRHGTPMLIIVDTLARNFGPGDENSNTDMGKFVAVLDSLRAEFPGCTIIVIHHTGHGDKGRARGAMALKGSLDCEYRLEKSGDLITLTNTKMKDAEAPPPITFKLEPVKLSSGAKSAVLRETEAPVKAAKLSPALLLAKETYLVAAESNGTWESGAFSGVQDCYWRERFYETHPGTNPAAKRQAFNRARSSLLDLGLLTCKHGINLWNEADVIDVLMAKSKRQPSRLSAADAR